ncbi:MuF-C-terminal domain-containing protein [Kingella oralis]
MPTDYAPPTYDEIRTALSYIPTPSSYADWYPMAYAIKDALGENGKDLWHDWSRQGDNYKASVAEATWKSAKSKAGGITVATLFKQARDNGYRPEKPYVAPNPEQRARIARERATQDEIWAAYNHVRHQSASRLANTIWRNAKDLTAADLAHPYLRNKDIQDLTAVAGIRINRYKGQNKLVIPIYSRNGQTGNTELVNLQQIEESGEKRFLAGGQKSGGYAILNGTHADMAQGFYLAEGYATAASVHLATGKPVVIAFDAGNLPVVAARIIERGNLPADTPIYLAADNDRASQKGLTKAAEAAAILGGHAQIRLPEFDARDITVWQQRHGQLDADGKEQFPSDFNDLAEIRGMDAVKEALGTPLSAERTAQVAAMQPEIARQIAHIQNKAPESPQESPETLPPDEAGLRFRAEYVLEKFGGERNEKHRNALIAELAQRGVDIRGAVNGILEERKAAPQPQPETAKPSPASENTPFTQAVDNVVAGKVPAGYIQLGTTPDVLQMLGVPQGKVRIAGGTIEKAVADYLNRQNAYDKNRHAVNPDDLKLLPGEMNDPIAVFKSATQSNSFVVLTRLHERENGKEKPVIAAVHLSQGKGKHGADLIDVVSVYGRSDTQLERAFQDDLLYANKKKVQEFLTTHPLQLHWDITSETELSYRHIKTESDLAQWQNAHRQPENTLPSQNLTQPKKEAQMAQSPTPEDIQRHAQNVAQIADAAEREAMMAEPTIQPAMPSEPQRQPETAQPPEPPQPTAADNAAVTVSESSETQAVGQPETAASPTFADELSALNLPSDFSFEYQTLPNGREIARIHLAGYGGEIMVDKIEADKGGGYIASFDKVLDGKPIHLDNLSTLMREMTFQMRQAAEREQHQERNATQPQRQPETAQPPEPSQPAAADNAAVAVSEPSETQTVEQPQNQQENTMPTPETNLVLPTREAAVEYEAINRVMQASTLAEMNRIEPRPDGVTDVAQYLQEQLAKNKEQLAHETDNAQREALQDDIAVGEIAVSLAQQGLSSQQLQQRAETLLAEAQRVPAAEIENSIEFGGITQEQAQSPAQPAEAQPQLETISAAEVQENLRRAKEKERIEAAQQQSFRQPENSPTPKAQQPESPATHHAPKTDNEPAPSPAQPTPAKPQPILDLGYTIPSGLNDRYVCVEGKYLDWNNRKTVIFKDDGSKLKTAKNDAQVISDMLDVAQAKNWGSIKISGSKDFRQAMWLEAERRGIASTGYKPNKFDLAKRDQMLGDNLRNSIETQHQPELDKMQEVPPTPSDQHNPNRTQAKNEPMPPQATQQPENRQPETLSHNDQDAGSLFDDDAARVIYSEADRVQNLAETPDEMEQAVQVVGKAVETVHDIHATQNVAQKQSAAFNPKLETARAVFQEKYSKLSENAKARVNWYRETFTEPMLQQFKESNQQQFHDLHLLQYYENTAKMMQGKNINLPAVIVDAMPEQLRTFEQAHKANPNLAHPAEPSVEQKQGRKM